MNDQMNDQMNPRMDNAKHIDDYIDSRLRKTRRCGRSVYSIKNGLHTRHTFSDEFAAALRRHGYTVTADGMVNATEVSP